jgi:hypothetical protein
MGDRRVKSQFRHEKGARGRGEMGRGEGRSGKKGEWRRWRGEGKGKVEDREGDWRREMETQGGVGRRTEKGEGRRGK